MGNLLKPAKGMIAFYFKWEDVLKAKKKEDKKTIKSLEKQISKLKKNRI